jgi:hypothetical protein
MSTTPLFLSAYCDNVEVWYVGQDMECQWRLIAQLVVRRDLRETALGTLRRLCSDIEELGGKEARDRVIGRCIRQQWYFYHKDTYSFFIEEVRCLADGCTLEPLAKFEPTAEAVRAFLGTFKRPNHILLSSSDTSSKWQPRRSGWEIMGGRFDL